MRIGEYTGLWAGWHGGYLRGGMEARAFCTIMTSGHAHFVVALFRSYRRFVDMPLHVLCVDRDPHIKVQISIPEGVHITYLQELNLGETGEQIVLKYQQTTDFMRWSLKPVWMAYLLRSVGCRGVIYVDPDVYFFSDPAFLFDLLRDSAILLSPHWRSMEPDADPINFELNFRDGIYNGGCIGATEKGIPGLEWLARACLHACLRSPERGLFLDQKYLDLLPARFEDVRSIQHMGCNIASWNRIDCKRILQNGNVLINAQWPIVFIHFTASTIRDILIGRDPLLAPFLHAYETALLMEYPAFPGFHIRPPSKKIMSKRWFRKMTQILFHSGNQ